MKTASCVIVGISVPGLYAFSFAQEVDAPTYKDGEWWKIRVELTREGASRSGACHEQYSEYLVRIEQDQPVVYAVTGDEQIKIDCPQITRELLNTPPESEYLKFSLAIGNSWTTRRFSTPAAAQRGRWLNYTSKVASFENVKVEKGELQAFKIERLEQFSTETYFYSVQAKAIVLFDRKIVGPQGGTASRRVTLIDFNVSP